MGFYDEPVLVWMSRNLKKSIVSICDNLKMETGLKAQSAKKKNPLLLNAVFLWNKTILKVNTDQKAVYPEGVLSYIMLVGEDRRY